MKNIWVSSLIILICTLLSCTENDHQQPLKKRFHNTQIIAKIIYNNTLYGRELKKELKKHTSDSLKNEKGYLYQACVVELKNGSIQLLIAWLADKSAVNGIEVYSESTKQSEKIIFLSIEKKDIEKNQNNTSVSCNTMKSWEDKSKVPYIFKSGNCKIRLIDNDLKPLDRWIPINFYTKEEYKKIVDKLQKEAGRGSS